MEQIFWERILPKSLSFEELHVWKLGLLAEVEESDESILSKDELKRADRYVFPRHRRQFCNARIGLRKLLAHYLKIEPESIEFGQTEFGKPFVKGLAGKNKVLFNISHSDELALFGFARGRELGIDLEKKKVIKDRLALAKRFFTQREYLALAKLPVEDEEEAFFACWTRKEAYIKAIGLGFSMPLDQFEVSLSLDDAALLSVAGKPREPERWQVQSFLPKPSFWASLYVEKIEGTSCDVRYFSKEAKALY